MQLPHPLIVLLLLTTYCLGGVLGRQDYGYGCREGNLPNEVRVDCYPEPDSSEEGCRRRGCVWCSKEDSPLNFPSCFFRNLTYEPPGPTCDVGYVPPAQRVDCSPGVEIAEMGCRYKNCTYCPSGTPNVPWCFTSGAIDSTGYNMRGDPVETPNGITLQLQKPIIRPQFDDEVDSLIFVAEFQSDYRLRIKITDATTQRFEVPINIAPPLGDNSNRFYEFQFERIPFSFRVIRRSSGAILFDSSAGKLTFADQFLSMTWSLPSENMYGIGENEQRSFRHDFSEQLRWPLWAAGPPPLFTTALYGVQPHYTIIEDDGSTHAVALVNSNSQEFHVLPGPTIKYITTGGVFDLYFFLGPTPDDTVSQYTEAVGRSQFPPYWGLGFQLCKYGYNSIEAMKEVVDRTEAAGIPHDVQYGDIDIMDKQLPFTYDKVAFAGLPEYIVELKERGIRFVTILDPYISIIEGPEYKPYTLGQEMDVWVKRSDGVTPVTARAWPHAGTAPIYIPDYSRNSTREWWRILIVEFHDLLQYDGLWIDMNEPSNFEHGELGLGCEDNQWNFPPYNPGDNRQVLFDSTLCPDHRDSVSMHYNTHSLYGWFQSEPTLIGTREGTGKRGFVLSRSTFLGSGKWATHWSHGDNWSRWSNLHYSIIGVMQFNLWGMPYVGPDICGHNGDATAQLCQRWMELGAFYPFSRNHNAIGNRDQDPASFGPEVAASSKAALEVRYNLLPYLYTLFYDHVRTGSAVFRPLWYNYIQDRATFTIDRQFMWGTGVLVTPVLEENATSVTGYFPDQRHYSYYDGAEVSDRMGNSTLDAPMNFIPVHIVGGNIIPTQVPARTTAVSRQNPLGLIVALDDQGEAHGAMFYDDGESIETHETGDYFYAEYVIRDGILSSNTIRNGYAEMSIKVFQTIRLLGHVGVVSTVTVNGVPHSSFSTTPTGEVLVTDLNIFANTEFTMTFA